jgi:hypothetical protein
VLAVEVVAPAGAAAGVEADVRAGLDVRREGGEHGLELEEEPVFEGETDDVVAVADGVDREQPQEAVDVGEPAVAEVVAEVVTGELEQPRERRRLLVRASERTTVRTAVDRRDRRGRRGSGRRPPGAGDPRSIQREVVQHETGRLDPTLLVADEVLPVSCPVSPPADGRRPDRAVHPAPGAGTLSPGFGVGGPAGPRRCALYSMVENQAPVAAAAWRDDRDR